MAKQEEDTLASGSVAAYAQAVHKRYGAGSIMTADSVSRVAVPRISTGIWVLDKALGGGLPIGRYSQVYGAKSTGKSSLFMRAVANAQRMCGNCYRTVELVPGEVEAIDPNTGEVYMAESMVVGDCQCGKPRNFTIAWVDQEGSWESNWAAKMGVYEERLLLSRPVFAEEAVDIMDGALHSGVDVVVLDSIAQMSPAAEVKDSAAKFSDHPGMHARIMGNAVRKWTAAMQMKFKQSLAEGSDFRVPTVLLVNQTRMKIGVKFGSPETTPGGNAVGFATSVEIRTAPGEYKVDDKDMETYYVELGVKVNKNKVGAARQGGKYRICTMDHGLYRKGQIIDYNDVLYHSLRCGVVEQLSNKKYRWAGDEYLGKKRLMEHWASNPEDYNKAKMLTLQVALQE